MAPRDEKDTDAMSAAIAAGIAEGMKAVASVLRADPQDSVRNQADAIKLAREETREVAKSNITVPLVSAFNPLGDTKNPRPVLRTKFTMLDAIDLDPDYLDLEELELLNAVQVGDYQIHKTSGEAMRFRVIAHMDEFGKENRVDLKFKCNEEDDKIGLPSLKQMLREALGQKAKAIVTMADWRELAAQGAA